jgi:membrane protease YdiL (CAAX protease family)
MFARAQNELATSRVPSRWTKLPISLRAIVSGLFLAVIALNVWPLLIAVLPIPLAAFAEAAFLLSFLWWARGGGPPHSTSCDRAASFRSGNLSVIGWVWGLFAALFFAVTVHASIVLLFRFVPFPLAAFRSGYDLSFIHSQSLKWVAIVLSALSAGICEEIGFRGYMQFPIERRNGPAPAILISSLFFMSLHLPKAWAILGMVPIVFGAGVLLGLIAWSARSLLPGMIGHVVMDIGLFAYWWTGVAGDFSARTISQTGVDPPFLIALFTFLISLSIVAFAIYKLRSASLELHSSCKRVNQQLSVAASTVPAPTE